MEYCRKKIEQLLRLKEVGENETKNETKNEATNGATDEINNFVTNKLLNDVVEIVKLTNKLPYTKSDDNNNNTERISNNEDINILKNSLLKIIYDLLIYSTNDKNKKKKLLENYENNTIPELGNEENYHIISSVLEEIVQRSEKFLNLFNLNDVDNVFSNLQNSKLDNNINDSVKLVNTNLEDETEKNNEIDSIYKNMINKNILQTSELNETNDVKKNDKNQKTKKRKKDNSNNNNNNNNNQNGSTNNNIIKENEHGKTKKKKLLLNNNSNNIKNSLAHLINNYAKYFIPRIHIKHNKLIDLEPKLIEAMKYQENIIKMKKKALLYNDQYKNNKLKDIKSIEIVNEIFKEKEIKDFETLSNVSEISEVDKNTIDDDKIEKHYNDMNSKSDLLILKEDIPINEYFFYKLLKKIDKKINKYCEKYNVIINNPYTFEINNLINMYINYDENVQKFLNIKKGLTKPININSKEYKIINNKNDLINMINTIKNTCDKISIINLIDYKNSYHGFTSLILIGTQDIDYIINVFNMFEDIYLLNEITTDSKILKITYNSENLILFFQKDFSIYFINIIDLLLCANCLNIKNSIPYLIFNYFNVNIGLTSITSVPLDKPLSLESIQIFRTHSHYLYNLFDYIITDLYYNYIFNRVKKENIDSTSIKVDKSDEDIISQKEHCIQNQGNYNYTLNLSNEINRIYNTNVYVNFEKIKFSDITPEEEKQGINIIKTMFIKSNEICLIKFEIQNENDNISKTKEKIKQIINTSYNTTCCDKLIENILIWRQKLSKKINLPNDNILNIHNIISIILNDSTSISNLKNNITPLNNIISENIESLFEVIVKSNINNNNLNIANTKSKKGNIFFYHNYLKNSNQNDHIPLENESNLISFCNHNNNNNDTELNSYDNYIIVPNMYFQSISNNATNKSGEKNDKNEINHLNKGDEMFALEKTFFSEYKNEQDDDNDDDNDNNDNDDDNDNNNSSNISSSNSSSNNFINHNLKCENYTSLSSLIISMNKIKEQMLNGNTSNNSGNNIKDEELKVKKDILKNKKKEGNNGNKNKQKYKSYNNQYNIKNKKGKISGKNILDEIM
ncbi:exosome complex exonuclease RRP6, putative [Plasmodium yoelii]|uniref:Exosome complex exonuclease RRP6 n=2 Tax=Plasmodium yoelii TaxID=5861 RepID=A0AAE9WVN6_PLAYO|nr:exosome complex exonuclease RRP6, putative [Plasmodium yoelii]WBY59841.1 exosome complex exonuclease RRP6 [Plasmodium yoelii yoelii]CDU19792.1 exosome complex exonuclease RRP6, putative [Plasmodium yoelii]VTZ80549.1 exosome complex exonuclease RRP6, putative [Plasmodium yoelii]|eukprot:XP_022813542.1 exosome complex exonuclease RRP6, putative [Plasmodium yoelii]